MGRRERGSNEGEEGLGKREDPGDKVEEVSLFRVQLQLGLRRYLPLSFPRCRKNGNFVHVLHTSSWM